MINPPQFPPSPLNTPRRRRINELLGRVGPNLQQFYRDGCRLIDATVVLESASNTVGNCAREIDSAVRAVFRTVLFVPHDSTLATAESEEYDDETDDGEEQPDPPKAKHKEEILAIIDALKLPRDSEVTRGWIRVATGRGGGKGKGFAKQTHRRALEAIPPLTGDDATDWARFEDLLAVVLPHLERRIVELLPRLRALAEIPAPTKAHRSELRRLPNTHRTRSEFFAHATPGWFRLLDRGQFFDQPQDAFAYDPVTGNAQPREWLAMTYLARMAGHPEHHERFITVAERVPIPHEWALRELVLVTTSLPVPIAVRLAKRYARWLRSQRGVLFVAEDLAAVAVWLGERGEPETAFDLLDALLALEPDPRPMAHRPAETDVLDAPAPVTRLRDYQYERVVERGLMPLARLRPSHAFHLAVRLLVRALELSTREPRLSAKRDLSPYNRRTLSMERPHYREHALDILTDATRDTARLRLTDEGASLGEVVTALELEGWTLCRRLALELILEWKDAAIARERLLDPTLIRDGGTWQEFRDLLAVYFGTFSVDERRAYVAAVESSATDGSDGDFTGSVDREEWIMRRLRSVAPNLEDDVLSRYPELAQWAARPRSREHDNDEFESGWVADKPDVHTDALAAMTIDDIVAHLKTWVAPATLGGPSVEGQAAALRAAVAADPDRYASDALAFADLDPTYVRSVLAAFEDAVRSKRAFEWGPVLRLASTTLSRPPVERRSGMDRDPDWTWTYKTIADLVQHGLETGPAEIPAALHAETWLLIADLATKSSNSGVLSDDTEDGPDALTAALNSIRGSALFAAVNYIGRLQRDRTDDATRGMDAAPPVRELLAYHLNPVNDRSLAARGVFGVRLGQLIAIDRAWVEQRREQFFPPHDEHIAAATWEAYVPYNQPSRAVLEIFPDQIASAIARSQRARSGRRNDPEGRMAEHLMAFYLRGYVGLDSPDGLMVAFYERAPAWLRGHAIEFLGRVQRDAKDLTPDHCDRLRTLWESRMASATSKSHEDRRVELEQFGWWFASESCDEEWRLHQLIETLKLTGSIENDSLVLEKLRVVATTHPLDAIEALELMIAEPKDRWLIHAWLDDVVAILEVALVDARSTQRARGLAARLVADGHNGRLVEMLSSGSGEPATSV